ncbi:MAG: hypothetical protein RJA13_1380 [Bacteroidota bacterium]|jgi:hypothetical protein
MYVSLRHWIIDNATHYSVISKVEVLGYPKLNKEGIIDIENILQHLESHLMVFL